jgi:DNA-directed RNA polymerase subunit delta
MKILSKKGREPVVSSSQYQLKITPEQAKEMPMVDLAFEVLRAANTPFYYRDLMLEIAKLKGFSEEDVMRVIAQLYTEINVDGRFACVGNNLWGLKRWYPVENKTDDGVGNAKRPRIINDEDDDLDEEDPYTEEEEDTYAAEEDEFDVFDEDREEIGIEAEEEEELFGEEIEDEEIDEADSEDSEDLSDEELDEEEDSFEDDGDEEDDDDEKGR